MLSHLPPWAWQPVCGVLLLRLGANVPWQLRKFYAGWRGLLNDMRRDNFLGLDRRGR